MQTFRDYMESALYDPERGYYCRRTPTEDFYTAPELHPAFAGVLAGELSRRLASLKARGVPGPYALVEMGSGDGTLARGILKEISRNLPPGLEREDLRYVLVERSRQSLLESVVSLSASYPNVLGTSRLEELHPCAGVFFSNELVDAFPVHLLEKRDGEVYEVYVEESGRSVLSDLSTQELTPHAKAVSPSLREGERHAVNLEALRWLRTVSSRITDGLLITIDYGKRFGSSGVNPPRSYRKHSTDSEVTQGKGSKDITASVDFDALIEEGEGLGLKTESFGTLSRFLIDGGIERWLPEDPESLEAVKARSKIKTLIHPEGMGEAFKVLIQSKEAPAKR